MAERDPDGTLKVLAHMLQLGRRLNLDGDTRNPLAAFDGTNQLNVESSRALASLCIEIGAWLVYLSTDYVFDGTRPPYHPGDLPNPLNFYGRSKLQGEEAVRAVNKDATILRVPIL